MNGQERKILTPEDGSVISASAQGGLRQRRGRCALSGVRWPVLLGSPSPNSNHGKAPSYCLEDNGGSTEKAGPVATLCRKSGWRVLPVPGYLPKSSMSVTEMYPGYQMSAGSVSVGTNVGFRSAQ